MSVNIKFLGGVGTVTGSSHLVFTRDSKILIDAGLFQGRRDEFYSKNTTFHYNTRLLDAILLSHAHLDHSGNIPNLIKRGVRCKIYTTQATRDLSRLMLEDSGKIQEEDIIYVNKINRRLGLPLRRPLYTRKEALNAMKKFRPISYKKKIAVTHDVMATYYNSGHILGAAVIVLQIKSGRKKIRLGYAVDLGRKNLPLLEDPVIPKDLDYLILESTYGGRRHAPIEEAKSKLRDSINRTVGRKGKIIIPSFTLERTQEVVYFLNELLKEKAIPSIPIYVDSPLATNITEVFKQHLECLDKETRCAVACGESPFEFLNLHYIRDQIESKALNNDKRPMIIIAGSGMCESGRVLHHLKNTIEDSRNTVLVVGYMAKDTLGRKIVERAKFVRIFGVEHQLNAEVVVINAFSGHADNEELVEFVRDCSPVKRVFLVHGDPEELLALRRSLVEEDVEVTIPVVDELVALT